MSRMGAGGNELRKFTEFLWKISILKTRSEKSMLSAWGMASGHLLGTQEELRNISNRFDNNHQTQSRWNNYSKRQSITAKNFPFNGASELVE